jgi:hypothetical protein
MKEAVRVKEPQIGDLGDNSVITSLSLISPPPPPTPNLTNQLYTVYAIGNLKDLTFVSPRCVLCMLNLKNHR